MADQLGSAVLTLSVDDRQYNAGLQRAKQTAEQAFGSVGKGGAGISGVATGLAALGGPATAVAASLAAIGVAIGGVGFFATRTAGEIQRLNAAFVGLTGSAEAAKQLRQELFTLSKTTPFKNEEILQAAQRFLAVGVSVKNLQGTINRVGAIAAQSGQSLSRLALIYAQVYAKGRVQGEENLQLLEAGVDLTQELTQVTGLSGAALQDAMSKGKIGVETFNKALKLATGDMSALQLAGQAVDVQFNNIGDNLGQVFGGLATSIAPAISAAFGVVNQVLEQAFPSLQSIEELFAPLTTEAKRFSEVLAGNPQLIASIAAGVREWAGLIVNNIADGLRLVSDILSKIDGEKLTKSFVKAEFVMRRIFLAASAVGLQLIKNAELTIRAASNPIQFGKDIASAGGFGKFLEREYRDVTRKWNDLVKAKPLTVGSLKEGAPGSLAGNLDNKLSANTTNAATAFRDAANKILDASNKLNQARIGLAELQASPDQGLNRFLTPNQQATRRNEASKDLAPFVNQAIKDANDILGRQGLALPSSVTGFLRSIEQANQKRIVGEINGRQIVSAPQGVRQQDVQAQLDFIKAVQEEKMARNNVAEAQVELATSLKDLAQKDWTVQVNVNADGSSAAYGDVLTRAVTP